jgi:hypothetical protein
VSKSLRAALARLPPVTQTTITPTLVASVFSSTPEHQPQEGHGAGDSHHDHSNFERDPHLLTPA